MSQAATPPNKPNSPQNKAPQKAQALAKAAPAESPKPPADAPKQTAAAGNASAATAEAEADAEADLPPAEHHGLSRRVVWGLAAGGSSMVVHLVLLLALGLIVVDIPIKTPPRVLEASVQEERPQEELTAKLEEKIQPATQLNAIASSAVSASSSVGVQGAITSAVAAPKMNTVVSDRPTSVKVDVGAVNVFTASGGQFVAAVPEGTIGDGLATAQGYGDAMDRITQEILNMLAKSKVMVVWCFDQSNSMVDDREEVTLRVERVYTELGLSAAAKDDALLTAITSYGATTVNHTPQPTYKPDEIMAAIRSVPIDETGLEMQCQAVAFALATFGKTAVNAGRQIAVVMVTDESGDMNTNITQLEQTIAIAKSINAKVYLLGRESVFGYPYAYMRHLHEETKTTHWLRIDRGPETPWPEALQIDGYHRRDDAFPSGFGPYEQSRMARETGGIFFMLPSPEVNLVGRRADLKYDGDAMRPYLPDLRSREEYTYDRDRSPLRATVWKVISDLNPWQGPNANRLGVQLHHFSIDRDRFAQQAQTQMKRAQDMIVYLQAAQKAMEEVAPLKNRDASVRWRANYELIYAQTLSYQARLQEYGWYLAEFVKNPKAIENKFGAARPTNEWNTTLVKRLLKPEVTQELRDKSDQLYRQIVKDHPGTPWAARAEWELRRNFGVELVEGYDDPRYQGVAIKLPKQ
jgi:hypothetical protein